MDARLLAPRLLYVKRWAPEDWALAFQGNVHLLSAADFSLVDNEIQRTVRARGQRREQIPERIRARELGVGATSHTAGGVTVPHKSGGQ